MTELGKVACPYCGSFFLSSSFGRLTKLRTCPICRKQFFRFMKKYYILPELYKPRPPKSR